MSGVLKVSLIEFIDFLGEPHWLGLVLMLCFDPILEWREILQIDSALFREIAEYFSTLGIERVLVMFYRSVQDLWLDVQEMPENAIAFAAAMIDDGESIK